MNFLVTNFKGMCIGLMFVLLLLLVFVASKKIGEGVEEVLAVRDDTLSIRTDEEVVETITITGDMLVDTNDGDEVSSTLKWDKSYWTNDGDYQPLVVMNEAPTDVGIPIGKILGYESDIIKRTPFDPPIEQGYPAMGIAANDNYTFVRVDANGYLLCSKVDESIWRLVPVDKKEVRELKQNDSLIIRSDAPMPKPSKESMP